MSETIADNNRKKNVVILKCLGIVMGMMLLLGIVVSCLGGSDKSQEATPKTTATASGTPEPSNSPTALKEPAIWATLDAVFQQEWNYDLGYKQAINITKAVCYRLDSGEDMKPIWKMVQKNTEGDPAAAGYVLGAASAGYCPQHAKKIEAVLK